MKHIKLLTLVAAFVPCLSPAAVNVVTNNFATGTGGPRTNPLTNYLGTTLLPAGSGIVAVGFFPGDPAVVDAAITAVGDNVAAWGTIAATFQMFGASATIGTGSGAAPGQPGLFGITPGAQVAGTPFSGKNVYVAIGSGATLAASTQYAVFKSTTTFADEPTPSVNAFLSDPAVGTPPAGTFLLGQLSAGTSAWFTTGPLANVQMSSIRLDGVPEPTVALLGALGLGIGFIRRRR
jgi:hypothetical protein